MSERTTVAEYVEKAIAFLAGLTDEERKKIFDEADARWCHSCGRAHPRIGWCQCENNE
ncbi:MAG TPA: hypothetical protein VJP77_05545 [Planctomycetota bacterium]|nr:hypothetical protein [Planctomycetota bacterium]